MGLRSNLLGALRSELTKGLTNAIVKEAARHNPDGRVSLSSLARQVREVEGQVNAAQEALTVALDGIEELKKNLTMGAEISPAFVERAVESYLATSGI